VKLPDTETESRIQCDQPWAHKPHHYVLSGTEAWCVGRSTYGYADEVGKTPVLDEIRERMRRADDTIGFLSGSNDRPEERIQVPAAAKANERGVRVTKQQLEDMLSEVISESFATVDKARDLAHKLSEKTRFADSTAAELGRLRKTLTEERELWRTIERENARLKSANAQLHDLLNDANDALAKQTRRIAKDKKRIKALVNALAGLR